MKNLKLPRLDYCNSTDKVRKKVKIKKSQKLPESHFIFPFGYKETKNNTEVFEAKTSYKKNFFDSVQSFSKLTVEKPLEEYNQNNINLMSKYLYNSPKDDIITNRFYETDMTKTKAEFFKKSKVDIENILNKSKLANTKELFKDDKKNKVKFDDLDFKGPYDSLGLLLKNKVIHDKILINYQDREVKQFGETISKFDNIKKSSNLCSNVKVTSIMPKTLEQELFSQNTDKNKEQEDYIPEDNNLKGKNKKVHVDNKIVQLTPYDCLKGSINLLVNYLRIMKCFPESREQFSFNFDNINNCIYLFSGNSCDVINKQLWKFNLNTHEWTHLKTNGLSPEPRSGHTGIIYKNKLIIFGGRFLHNTLMCDTDIYNMETNSWIPGQNDSNLFLKLRRNHIACLIGQQMLVHGGIDENGNYLDDSYLMNLTAPYKWLKTNIMPFCPPPLLAYHSACLVVSSDIRKNPKFTIYKFPEITLTKRLYTRIREKGVYIFGGKSKDLGPPNNSLWLLKIGKRPLEWVEIKARGRPPCPRYLCSMEFFEEGNFLIIHGGKTKNTKHGYVLRDTYLFELYRYDWVKVDYGEYDSLVQPRSCHSSIITQKKIIIFGGINEKCFLRTNFFIINLDPEEYINNLISLGKADKIPTKNPLFTEGNILDIKDDLKVLSDKNNKPLKINKNVNEESKNGKNKNASQIIKLTK